MNDMTAGHRAFKKDLVPVKYINGYQIYIHKVALESLYGISDKYTADLLERRIYSLTSNPRAVSDDTHKRKNSVDHLKQLVGDYQISYRIISGEVTIYSIDTVKSAFLERAKQEKPGLYHVKLDPKRGWSKEGSCLVNKITTKYAAVNGMLNDHEKAVWLMAKHIEYQYGEGINEFTLYHNPSVGALGDLWECTKDKVGQSTGLAVQLSEHLRQSQSDDKDVHWVAHSQGGIIFSEAVRYHLNGNSRWAITGGFNGVFSKGRRNSLDKHVIAFHGSGANHLRSSTLCKRAGMTVLPPQSNRFDGVNKIAGFNAFTEPSLVNLLGSAIFFGRVAGGSANTSPHTTPEAMEFGVWKREVTKGAGKPLSKLQRGFLKSLPTLDFVENTTKTVTKFAVDNFLR